MQKGTDPGELPYRADIVTVMDGGREGEGEGDRERGGAREREREREREHLDAEAVEVLRVLHLTHASRGRQQSLGGNTPAVHTRATHVTASEDGGLETLATRVQRRAVSTNAAPDDDDVVVELCAYI